MAAAFAKTLVDLQKSVAGAIVTELPAGGHGSEKMAAANNAAVKLVVLQRIWRDICQIGSHIDIFIAEFAHVQIHVVQKLIAIPVIWRADCYQR